MAAAQPDPAREAWRMMSALVLNHDRKAAVSKALGLSFARVRALRRLVAEPLTLRALAEALLADPPYVTLIVDDLEEHGLVERRPHPQDRRAKIVSLTPAGHAAAAEADRIMGEPPAALRDLPADELAELVRLLGRASD
jgi:DNA-binding MarR family transcriptional regulator